MGKIRRKFEAEFKRRVVEQMKTGQLSGITFLSDPSVAELKSGELVAAKGHG